MLAHWNAVTTLDRMLDDVMGSAFGTATNTRTFAPNIDVRSTEADIVFVCDVPGIKQDDLEITLVERTLVIKGSRRFESRENERLLLGRAYGSFTRTFTLPDAVDEEKLAANLADGVLTIKIPKHPKAQPRKITIGASPATKQLDE